MHPRSFFAAALAAAGVAHPLRLGLQGAAVLGMASEPAEPAGGGLERRQGETVCPSIDPSECMLVKRDRGAGDDGDD
ncbi:hypothetical protein LX36DRAFT_712066 [Colletotrichum falcatum]|nr:hypothetical protein LX36DRAFT_712066 [Colletotrichum falcatum]